MKPLFVAEQLACKRGRRMLFQQVNMTLSAGDVWQIAGKNGVGKTTLLRMLCGLMPPWQGRIRWRGQLLTACYPDFYSDMAYMGHQLGLKDDLTAYENLMFDVTQSISPAKQALQAALTRVGLLKQQRMCVGKLSAGQRRRVAVARLLLAKASLWVLDEPFTALDQQGVAVLQQVLAEHVADGGLVIFSSHQALCLPDSITVQRLCLDEHVC